MSLWGLLWRRQRPSGFGPASTAEEVTAGVDAGHLTAIVTGATSGIGKETARVLTLRGAKVIIAARTLESGMAAKESLMLTDKIPSSKLHVMEMDLSSLDSVRSFAQSFVSSHEHLNILINNAGVYLTSFRLSKDGIELQFATNHLGHFLLTNLLLDKMKTTAEETGVQGRIINVSSVAHKFSNGSCFDLETIGDESNYVGFGSFSAETLPEEHTPGAATVCYLALHPMVKDVSGKYFEDCNEATPSPLAEDVELAKKLWDLSEEMVKRRPSCST